MDRVCNRCVGFEVVRLRSCGNGGNIRSFPTHARNALFVAGHILCGCRAWGLAHPLA